MRKTVSLYKHTSDGTTRHLWAEILENGDLLVSGHDLGKAPEAWWGDSDYEFWVSVQAHDKGAVRQALLAAHPGFSRVMMSDDDALLVLLEARWGGNPSAVDDFRIFLAENGVAGKFETWR
ncbi:MAG: hypothetical protein JXA21_14195 [Anaerolineae bacterium]|nr:hypothetical protein [Anaerolineae bacterium]